MTRPDVDEVMLRIAAEWSTRSTCSRLHVGAVIARDGRTLSSGYNGAPAGVQHCSHGQSMTDDLSCTVAVHAEENAILYAARVGVKVEGATMYTTHSPCAVCARMIYSSGIVRVVYQNWYKGRLGEALLLGRGVGLVQRIVP